MSQPVRLLLLHDEVRSYQRVVHHLEVSGFVVDATSDLKELLLRLEDGSWDLVLIDHKDITTDDSELLRQVRNVDPEVEVLLITDREDIETAAEAIGLELADFLSRPASLLELSCRLNKLLELRRTRMEVKALREEHFPDGLGDSLRTADSLFTLHTDYVSSVNFNEVVRRFEGALIRWAMDKADGKKARAADLLGLPRTTLISKMSSPHGKGARKYDQRASPETTLR